ncbi:hypothetical protein COT75_03290 [Candidatus Beckwithbacteria bacterium CG10_big_fil_rev_8_21_14_0_10_34_10]|uniref:Fibronectin type-III domain-containing protein n=1 Tax=Candidatus Beckwithbacteria bacterium CG10_big_fil_rev_8_21_14_0_10_34_10 TaxID=1974495 RepID=A0A2H0W913_9BACT|nr:MAG: hypothetical protein COT75_03290 [Candidatus Beckwithbacteria bacterium CG10_big_fil_rev_8_21_14_0_10_34_10]
MKKVVVKILAYLFGLLIVLFSSFQPCLAATTSSVAGKALVINTNNSYLDFTNYSSNVTVNNTTGNFSGYAFLEDFGWLDFGSQDNPSGAVNLNLSSGAVTGKAYVLNTGAYLDFTNYSSNVTLSFSTGAFAGFAFSEDAGWLDFSDIGVSLSDPGPAVSGLACFKESSHTTSIAENTSQSDGQVSFTWTDLRPQTGDYFYYEYNQTSVDSITGDESYTTDIYKNDLLLREGTWYFHLRPRVGESGAWGTEEIFTIIYDGTDLSLLTPGLKSPDDKAYLNNSEPTFIFKKSLNSLSGVDHYELIIDAGRGGSFSFDNIPSEYRVDLGGNKSSQKNIFETDKIWVYYENWEDDNNDNDYLHVRILEKDKILKEGARKWTVKAVDSQGNSREASRILNIDLTKPQVSLQKLGGLNFDSSYERWYLSDQKPTFTGEITDSLAGEKIAQDNQEKVQSGPAKIEVEILKKTSWGIYKSYLLSTAEIKDKKAEPKADFSYLPEMALDLGQYKVTVSAFDNAANQSEKLTFFLEITGAERIEKLIEEVGKESGIDIPEEEKQQIIKDLEIGGPEEKKENILKRLLSFTGSTAEKIYWFVVKEAKLIVAYNVDLTQEFTGVGISLMKEGLEARVGLIRQGGQTMAKLASVVGVENRLVFDFIAGKVNSSAKQVQYAYQTSRDLLTRKTTPTLEKIKITASFLTSVWLDKEPTRIANVKVAEVGPDYALITWETNHYATSKVNFGQSYDYGKSIESDKRVKKHQIKITGLEPGKEYFYEVMSQNKNYVFDARHEFMTALE